MNEFLKETLNLLKDRVQYNLRIIRQNELQVREILKEPVSSDRSDRLDEKHKINNKMLKENNDSIKLQLSIIQFIDKYGKQLQAFSDDTENIMPGLKQIRNSIEQIKTINSKSEQKETSNELNRSDYFDLTINGGIEFDERHPYFQDKKFLNELLEYYTQNEDYEMCSKLVAQQNSKDHFMNN